MNTILSLIPSIIVIVLSLKYKNVLIALFAGIVAGSIILNGFNFIPPLMEVYMVKGLESNSSVLIGMILLGIMLQFIKRAGGYKAFGEWCSRKVTTSKQTTVTAFWASIFLAVHAYTVNLTVPKIMKPVAIENGVTPEKISAIVASTVSPISSMLPFTPFILFFSGLIASSVEGYNGYELYFQAIPFQLFAIVSLITSFLMAYEIIPDIGLLKKLKQELKDKKIDTSKISLKLLGGVEIKPDMTALVLPISVFVLSIVVFSFTAGSLIVTAGPLTGCIAAIIYSMVNKSVKFNEIMDGCVEGCKDMSDIFLILLFAFSFGQVVNALEFAPYIISLLGSSFPMEFIPVITFLVCCIISYSTGSLGAAAIIVFPLGLPLALATGASIPLTIGACISGSHFGDLYSPISDSIIMPSQASDISPITLSHALTPYRLIQLAICTVLFVIFGYVM